MQPIRDGRWWVDMWSDPVVLAIFIAIVINIFVARTPTDSCELSCAGVGHAANDTCIKNFNDYSDCWWNKNQSENELAYNNCLATCGN